MAELASVTSRRLCTQGFVGVDRDWLAEISPWLRLSPALCAIFAALGTALPSPAILWLLALTALLGAVLPFHPFDLIYNYGIRFALGKRMLPPNGAPRRFACGLATIWLSITALLFSAGAFAVAYALGGLFAATAGLAATTDICIPSHIYHALQSFGSRHSPTGA